MLTNAILFNLTGNVDVSSRFPEAESSASLKLTLMYAQMCRSKLIDFQFDSLDPSEQRILI